MIDNSDNQYTVRLVEKDGKQFPVVRIIFNPENINAVAMFEEMEEIADEYLDKIDFEYKFRIDGNENEDKVNDLKKHIFDLFSNYIDDETILNKMIHRDNDLTKDIVYDYRYSVTEFLNHIGKVLDKNDSKVAFNAIVSPPDQWGSYIYLNIFEDRNQIEDKRLAINQVDLISLMYINLDNFESDDVPEDTIMIEYSVDQNEPVFAFNGEYLKVGLQTLASYNEDELRIMPSPSEDVSPVIGGGYGLFPMNIYPMGEMESDIEFSLDCSLNAKLFMHEDKKYAKIFPYDTIYYEMPMSEFGVLSKAASVKMSEFREKYGLVKVESRTSKSNIISGDSFDKFEKSIRNHGSFDDIRDELEILKMYQNNGKQVEPSRLLYMYRTIADKLNYDTDKYIAILNRSRDDERYDFVLHIYKYNTLTIGKEELIKKISDYSYISEPCDLNLKWNFFAEMSDDGRSIKDIRTEIDRNRDFEPDDSECLSYMDSLVYDYYQKQKK